MLELVVAGTVCIVALALVVWFANSAMRALVERTDRHESRVADDALRHGINVMRIVAQTDERTKAFMRNSDKVLDRWMAVSAPQNYANMRQNSGIIEGAQHGTKQHFVDPTEPVDAPLSPAELADQATLRMNRVKAGLDAAIQDRGKVVPVATALDFDRMQNGGP